MKDTPQSCGLPSIEEHTGEYPPDEKIKDRERELSAKEILFKYVLNNKFYGTSLLRTFSCISYVTAL